MKIAVIGGGASGLTAAIAAAKNGAEVTIYEKLNRVGKKILATGNGRCNYTNMNLSKECYHSKDLKLTEDVMNFFDLKKTLDFFENLGIFPYVDDSGKVFPNSLQASSVLDVLRYELQRLKVKELTDFNVTDLRKTKDKFSVIGNDTHAADRVILSTGGKASPQLGSDGKGYEIARSFGHEIVEPFPALVQLRLSGKYFKRMAGIKFDGIVKAYAGERLIREEEGEILFTDYGISGPPILQVSRRVIEELNKKNKPFLTVDMLPLYSKLKLYEILEERFRKIDYKTIEEGMVGFINKKLIPVVLYEAGFDDINKLCGRLNKKEIYKIIDILKEWK
ncbi:MAG TPA: aminoacetone oxidase family FAD-binding enzyme, partial [Sedimentibacter sp.]|nr:aminoacetone oxidase family FAD-binding enzyme [Sedimentibacter sp.]